MELIIALFAGLPKSTVDSVFSGKDWPENIRSLLPNLTANVSQPPPNAFNPQKSKSSCFFVLKCRVLDCFVTPFSILNLGQK